MNLTPLLTGLWATILAGLQLCGWMGLGFWFISEATEIEIGAPLAVLVGSGITSAMYAVCAGTGQLTLSITLDVLLCALGAAVHWRRVVEALLWTGTSIASIWPRRRWLEVIGLGTVAAYWIVSIAPPRDADVLRYHLTHIRQIIAEGSWKPVPDYHYALPFGWSLNYLPFERFHLSQAAHLLNFGLWLLAVALLVSIIRRFYTPGAAILFCALFVYSPQMMKAATTAHADMYITFATLAIGILMMGLPRLGAEGFALLGFAGWISANSRYQGIGLGIAVSVIAVVVVVRRRLYREGLWFLAGASGAILLSAPFYIFNYLAFRNPFWPIAVPEINGVTTYADQVAAFYTSALTGHLALVPVLKAIWYLIIRPDVFPLPLFALVLPPFFLFLRPRHARYVVGLMGLFFVIWTLSQPVLFYRYCLMLAPLVLIGGAVGLYEWHPFPGFTKTMIAGLMVCIAGAAAFQAVYVRHFLSYAVTGDAAAFHRFTWFYEPYQWVNQTTARDASFLVVVSYGETYYLDRFYRRADPWSSGVVDWPKVETAGDLNRFLDRMGYQYFIYEDKDWSAQIGGEHMSWVVKSAIASGELREVASFGVPLGTIGILSELGLRPATVTTTVRILQPAGSKERSGWAAKNRTPPTVGGTL